MNNSNNESLEKPTEVRLEDNLRQFNTYLLNVCLPTKTPYRVFNFSANHYFEDLKKHYKTINPKIEIVKYNHKLSEEGYLIFNMVLEFENLTREVSIKNDLYL